VTLTRELATLMQARLPLDRALSILAYGQSADPESPHYFDQGRLFARGELKPSWTTLEEVRRHHEKAYHPGEETEWE